MLTTYNLKMPHAVYGGENAMDHVTSILKACGSKHVAVFTGNQRRRSLFPSGRGCKGIRRQI